jgi:hypothetical protein
MRYNPRFFMLLALVLLTAAGSVFGQGLLPKKIWNLTIAVNVDDAQIYVDSTAIPGNTTKVTGGLHNVRVHADGFAEFNGSVTVTSHMTFNVRLVPLGFPLTIRVNTPNAAVFLDGNDITGSSPVVAPGSHSLQVTAPGFLDYNSSITIRAPQTIDVALQPAGFLLSVNANVPNATVTINNQSMGSVPYSEYLPPGSYSVRVSANGYSDYAANVMLDRAVPLNVQLQPVALPSTLTFVIPPAFRDPDARGGDPQSQIRIYVDNRLVNAGRDLDRIPITPGRHVVRVSSGSFSTQIAELVVQAGMSYVIELAFDLRVRPVPSTR